MTKTTDASREVFCKKQAKFLREVRGYDIQAWCIEEIIKKWELSNCYSEPGVVEEFERPAKNTSAVELVRDLRDACRGTTYPDDHPIWEAFAKSDKWLEGK